MYHDTHRNANNNSERKPEKMQLFCVESTDYLCTTEGNYIDDKDWFGIEHLWVQRSITPYHARFTKIHAHTHV